MVKQQKKRDRSNNNNRRTSLKRKAVVYLRISLLFVCFVLLSFAHYSDPLTLPCLAMPRIALPPKRDGRKRKIGPSGLLWLLECITYFPIDSEHEGSLLLAPALSYSYSLSNIGHTSLMCKRERLTKAVTRSAQK